jgi:hypothetical protein
MLLSADASARFPTVKVEDADIDGARVILGEQGGILRILIRDRGTLRPIAGAKAIVRDARDARAFVELNADDQDGYEGDVERRFSLSDQFHRRITRQLFGEQQRLINAVPGERWGGNSLR